MTKLWELFRTSVVLQFALALIVTLTVCALYLMGRGVPLELVGAWMLILGFVFGQKVQQSINQNRRNG
ncbi:unnamed protein product [marine sediment metagenome]|uniref:Uncharacterized protein n=1 Tax=marine sediment metagenome TaxID=412755 RepID=X1QB02_9ZZZZ